MAGDSIHNRSANGGCVLLERVGAGARAAEHRGRLHLLTTVNRFRGGADYSRGIIEHPYGNCFVTDLRWSVSRHSAQAGGFDRGSVTIPIRRVTVKLKLTQAVSWIISTVRVNNGARWPG